MFRKQANSDISDSETHELATRMSVLERGMNRLVNAQLNDSRSRHFSDSDTIPDGTKGITLLPPSNNSVLINTLFIVAETAAGAITIKFGNRTLPAITPTNQVILLNLGEEVWPLSNADRIVITTASAGKLYAFASGKQRGDAYLVG